MNKVRTGVIGVGYLGKFHAEKYAGHPDVELVGVVDADPSRSAQVAQSVGTNPFRTHEDLYGKVDAVSVVVPTALHHRVAKSFLEQGVHALIEKPITVTLEQADELIDHASRKGAVLQVGHIERYNPAVTAIKSILKSPRYIQAERSAPFTVRCTDVNVILDLMIHDLDIVADLAGSEPREVSAAGKAVITREIDTVMARVIFRNGCVADIAASRVSDEKKRLLKVFDGDAVYVSDYQTQRASVSTRTDGHIPEFVSKELPTEQRDTLNDEIHDFIRCVRTKSRPLVSGLEGRKALALAQLITKSVENGITNFISVA